MSKVCVDVGGTFGESIVLDEFGNFLTVRNGQANITSLLQGQSNK